MNLLFSILAVSDKWFFDIFQSIREDQLSTMNSDYLETMIILAAIIIAFKLIKLSYTIMSDEQNGGFGGISMWEVLRPIVVLMLLINCSFILSIIDGTCNMISTALVNDSGYTNVGNKVAIVINNIDKYESKNGNNLNSFFGRSREARLNTRQLIDTANTIINNAYSGAGITLSQDKNVIKRDSIYTNPFYDPETTNNYFSTVKVFDKHSPYLTEARAKLDSLPAESRASVEGAIKALETSEKYGENKISDDFFKMISANAGAQKSAQKATTLMAEIVFWLFDVLFAVMMAFAEIFLMIMAMMLPVTLTLSLFDKWKDSFSSWAGRYIEISLWKVVGALICVATVNAKESAVTFVAKSSKNAIENYMNMQSNFSTEELISMESALIICTCIGLAGIISLISIPSITNTAISLSSESAVSGAETGGGTAKGILFAPAKATAGGVKGANALKGLKK